MFENHRCQGWLFRWLTATIVLGTLGVALSATADDFNWENINGQNWLTPVKNQASTGACWDFAACGALEAKYMLTRNDNTYQPNVSEQHMVCDGTAGGINGGYQDLAVSFLTNTGVVSEAELPFTYSSTSPNWPLASGWESRVFKATACKNYLGTNLDTVKGYLRSCGPLVLFMEADNEWYSPSPGSFRGYHSIVIVGYHDDAAVPGGGYWIIKNSWGSSWNSGGPAYVNHGYGAVSYAERPVSYDDISAFTGQVYYTGSMAKATWNGGDSAWSNGGNNWTKTEVLGNPVDPVAYAWENKETSATFASPGATVTLSGTVIAHGVTIASGAAGYSFSGGSLTVTAGGITASESVAFGSPISVGAPQTWTVASTKTLNVGDIHTIISPLTIGGSGNTVITGSIDGGGVINIYGGAAPGKITKTGSGVLTLSGAANYSVDLRVSGGKLDFAQPGGVSATYSGAISGNYPVVKSAGGAVTLSGANTYTGSTQVRAGTLVLTPNAYGPVLDLGGVDFYGGQLVFDYTGISTPAATILASLDDSYSDGAWDVGQFRSPVALAAGLTLGWFDDMTGKVTVAATYPGDFNLDCVVNLLDLDIWKANVGAGSTWQQGDVNYDGLVNNLDLNAWMANAGRQILSGAASAGVGSVSAVPEPGTLSLLAAGLIGLLAFARRRRK